MVSGGINDGKKGDVYGYDGGKHVKGRKRHIIVDTLLLMVVVIAANMNDGWGALAALLHLAETGQSLEVIWVDRRLYRRVV